MNRPKRHHFVPEVLLKRFTDSDEWLHVYSLYDRRVRRTRTSNAFIEGHLYSEIDGKGSIDPRVETELSKLETAVAPILKKFDQAASTGSKPNLSDYDLLIWRFFLMVQWRRVPDLHQTVTTHEESAGMLHEILDQMEAQFPTRIEEIRSMRSPDAIRRTVRNARIRGVPEVSDRVLNALATRGLAILCIRSPGKAFLIGSRPVVQMAFRNGLSLMDEATEMWLPISSKIAIGVGSRHERETIYYLSDHAAIRHLNLAVARQSTEFASRAAALTQSISNAR